MGAVTVWCVSLSSLAVAAVAAASEATPPSGAPAASALKLRVAHVYDEKYAWHRGFERFRDVLKAKSGGSLDVEIYARGAGGTLVSELDYVSHLRKGALDGATVSPAAITTVVPEAAFLDLMYLWKDREHWRRALDGDVGRRIADVIRTATAKGNVPGFEVLGYWGGNTMNLVGRSRGYQTLEDLAGLRVRVQDTPVQLELWRALGAKPSTIPYASVKDALKEGTIDAAVSVSASTLNMKFHEGGRHVTETGHAITVRPFLLSGHAWKKLSAEQRDWVMEAAKEATQTVRSLEAQDDRDAEALMKTQHGVKFYPFLERDAMREQTQPVRERMAKELKLEELLDQIESAWGPGRKKK